MSIQICFHGEIRKIPITFDEKKRCLFDISYESFAEKASHMECQALFSPKKNGPDQVFFVLFYFFGWNADSFPLI